MYLLSNSQSLHISSLANKTKTALNHLNFSSLQIKSKKKHNLTAMFSRWLPEPVNHLNYRRIGGREQIFITSIKDDLLFTTWKIVKYSGRVRGDNKDMYTEERVFDIRLINSANLHHAVIGLSVLGESLSDNLSKNFQIGLSESLQKTGTLGAKKRMLQRWVGNFVFTTKIRFTKAKRLIFKSSGLYSKIHSWKYKRRTNNKLLRNWGSHWVRNNMKNVNFFNKTKINQRFKLITLAEFSKTDFRKKEGNDVWMIRAPVKALHFRAWKNMMANEDLFSGYGIGGSNKDAVKIQEDSSRTLAWSLMTAKRKSFRKSTIYGLIDLAAILNPTKLKKQIGHPYHLVTPSVLPVSLSLAFFGVFQNFLGFMWCEGWHTNSVGQYHAFFFINLFVVILTWILEIFKEEQSGAHTVEIQKGFQYAILLFILSELMLFFSFFWAYFHYTLNSNSFTGGSYAPRGLVVFYWYRIPLLNTLLLLASGLSLTIAHILLVESDKMYRLKVWVKLLSNVYDYRTWGKLKLNKLSVQKVMSQLIKKDVFWSKFGTPATFDLRTNNIRFSRDNTAMTPKVFLLKYKGYTESVVFTPVFWVIDTTLKGFVFLMYQAYEYTSSMFSINDSVYGAVFFSLTGLHGLHVFIGVMSLFTYVIVTLARDTEELYFAADVIDRMHWGRPNMIIRLGTKLTKVDSSYKLKYFNHRVAFDGAAWYWHFVDVVWFFVFVFVYWWGFSA